MLIPSDHRSVTKKKKSSKNGHNQTHDQIFKTKRQFQFKVFYILLQNAQNLLGVYVMQSSNLKAMIAFPNNIVLRMVTIVLSQ